MSAEEAGSPGRVTIGLSFGNSYSSIASTLGGNDAIVIANEEGDRQIPSILSYVQGEEFQGTQAKVQLVRNASNTVAHFRDFLGKSFQAVDPSLADGSSKPLSHDNTIAFSVQDIPESNAESLVTVADITTRHLRRLKQSASDYIGKSVNAAVVAVPTDFSDAQKDAVVEAAKNAGIEVLQLVAEPVAALLASDRKLASADRPADKIAVVADFGGTRSDVAVIAVRGGMYSILATTHDYNLGGNSLDDVLIEHFAKEFMKKHGKTVTADPQHNARGAAKMRIEAEAVKKALSIGNTANFNVESLADGIDYSATVNRVRFEMLGGKVFARLGKLTTDAVEKAGLDVLDVDEVILAGGSSHVPRIASSIGLAFPDTTKIIAPSIEPEAVNPSELIARGAALQAYLIEEFEKEDIEQNTHPAVTVTPHLKQTLGLVLKQKDEGAEQFKSLIPAETPLPVRRTLTFLNSGDSDGTLIQLCEGVRNIKVTKMEPEARDKDEDEEDSDDDDEEEPEEVRSKEWKAGAVLGEIALQGAKKGVKITVQVQISADLGVQISASEVGAGKTGVRGTIEASGSSMNGNAH